MQCNVERENVHYGVSYRRLSDWTRLQWALCSHNTQQASTFYAVRGGDAALPKLLWEGLLLLTLKGNNSTVIYLPL